MHACIYIHALVTSFVDIDTGGCSGVRVSLLMHSAQIIVVGNKARHIGLF